MRWLVLVGMLAAMPALGHDFTAGALSVGHPYAIETPPGAKSAAGYFTITNDGPEADRLTAVQVPGVQAELHVTETGADGVARMLPVEGIDIAPGTTVTLAPRGLHVMFMGVTQAWVAGDEVPGTLVFEKAGAVPVAFAIQPRGQQPAAHGAQH